MEVRIQIEHVDEMRVVADAMQDIATLREDRHRKWLVEMQAPPQQFAADIGVGVGSRSVTAMSVAEILALKSRIDAGEGAESAEEIVTEITDAREIVTTPAETITEAPSAPEIVTVDPAELTAAMRAAAGRAGLPAAVEVLKRFGVTRVPDLAPEQGRGFLDALAALPAVAA